MSGDTEQRISCHNPTKGREFFRLRQHDRTLQVDTPGALTRTYWTRNQAESLRDALDAMLRNWS